MGFEEKFSYSVTDSSDAYGALGSGNTITNYRAWYVSNDGSNYTRMSQGDKFVAGKYYKFSTWVRTADGYEFPLYDNGVSIVPKVSATVNGYYANVKKAYDQDPARVIVVEYNFGMCNDDVVENITITNIDAPVAGQTPDYTANCFGTGYSMAGTNSGNWKVNGIVWLRDGNIYTGSIMDNTEKFQPGHEYTVMIDLVADYGYTFLFNHGNSIYAAAAINGNTAQINIDRCSTTEYQVWYTFTCAQAMLKNSFYCGIITYHKEYTPDYLKQKKIKNYGDIEYLTVKGKHTPIVTEEEFNQVQKIMNAKSRKMKNLNKGKHTVGYKPHSTAYGRLMICQCGKKFNQRFHTRDGRTDGVDYQCYTSVNRGSICERERRGLSVEGHCDSPFIQGWKLEMMAERIFERYIDNADAVMDLSYSMLEKHIADQEDTPDYTEEIKRKESEIERLSKKRVNLIEMRAEGDIDKELFRERKQEIENRIAILTEEIKTLQPDETKQSPQDYMQKLQELRERLKEYTGFEYSVIPESIVEAFIEKIWVSKDEFRWYLRSGNGSSDEFDIDDHIKIASFTLTIDDAKKYLYSFSTRRRVYNWQDLNVSIWI